jgi:hypothetical protein
VKKILFLLLLLPVFSHAQVGWEWVRGIKGPTGSEGNYCATDATGSVYGSGNHWGTIYFGTDTVTGAGAYVVKYDSIGNLKWVISTNSGSGVSGSLGLATDLFGNEYLLGAYNATISLGGQVLTTPGPSNYYYFLAKIDANGGIKWIKNIGNTASSNLRQGDKCITTDKQGDVYITCSFTNNPTIGGYSFMNAASNNTDDILVAKFDSSGNVIWANTFGGTDDDVPFAINVAPSGNIYIAGYFLSKSIAFGSTTLTDTSTMFYSNIYLAKLNSSGTAMWAKGSVGSGASMACGVVADASDNVFVTASYWYGSISLGSTNLLYPSYEYGLLAKYDALGNQIWVKQFQGKYIFPYNAVLDGCNNVWIIGAMGDGHLTNNDTIDGYILIPPSINGDPNFIAGWNSAGNIIDAFSLNSGSDDDPNDLCIDKCGNIFVIADQEDCDTIIIAGDSMINTQENMFIAKYNPNLGCGHCKVDLVRDFIPVSEVNLYPNPAQNNDH